MTFSKKWTFSMVCAMYLLATMLIVGCSHLPWSKSKGREGIDEGKAVNIKDLEYIKGVEPPSHPEKGPPSAPKAEGEAVAPSGIEVEERGEGEKIALAPAPPADLTFSPVEILKRKICVMDFEDRTGPHGEKYGELAALRLFQELEKTQKMVLVNKEVVLEALTREGIEPEGFLEPHAMKKAHWLLGIQAFITGSISDLQLTSSPPVGERGIKSSMASARIELRLIDASTGNLLRTFVEKNPSFTSVETGLHSDHRCILKAIDYDAARLVDGILRYLDFLEWSSTVARVEGEKLYINAGRLTGLRVGVILDVYEPGQEIINPITKFSLGWTTGQRKGRVMVTRLFGVDASIAKPINGAGFTANDIIKVPQQ